jgi:SpoVK/Ycf46/Vps4 family AAA+-type ATPase
MIFYEEIMLMDYLARYTETELSQHSTKLEDNLTNILHLAHHWNAMLLLDEADVFLEQRSHENVNRNALVSVFLRQLEYFQGAMFLTTNRVNIFDPAFQSRIHFVLRYEKLGEQARAKAWTEFLKRSGPNSLSLENLKSLARKDLNGRQVGLRWEIIEMN